MKDLNGQKNYQTIRRRLHCFEVSIQNIERAINRVSRLSDNRWHYAHRRRELGSDGPERHDVNS